MNTLTLTLEIIKSDTHKQTLKHWLFWLTLWIQKIEIGDQIFALKSENNFFKIKISQRGFLILLLKISTMCYFFTHKYVVYFLSSFLCSLYFSLIYRFMSQYDFLQIDVLA